MTGVDSTAAAQRFPTDAEAIEVAREFALSLVGEVTERDRTRRVPVGELAALGRTGLLGLQVPREHGGAEADMATIVEVVRTISSVDPAIGQVPQNHYQFVDAILRYGTESQRRLLLPEVARGARFGNAVSERGGKNHLDMKTRLRTDADGILKLDGRKFYSTGALTAAWIPVMAKDEDDVMAVIYVPRETEGVTVDQDWTAFGQRSTISGTTVLADVVVEPEWVIRLPIGERADTFAAFGQILHAAVDVGIARGALEDAARFLRDHSRPWFEAEVERALEEPHAIVHVGKLETNVRAAEALLRDAARLFDAATKDPTPESISAARLGVAAARAFGAETALTVSSDAVDVLGSSATDERHGLDRHWRNARTHTLHDPTRWKYVHLGNYLLTGEVADPGHPSI